LVLENEQQSSRKIDWDAADYVKKTVSEVVGPGRHVELLMEAGEVYPFGDQN
jgi:hypothetical protein